MNNENKALSSGLIFLAIGGLVLLAERRTGWGFSGLVGKLYCGESSLQTAGQVDDGTCGFNMDMLVGRAAFLLCLLGIILMLVGLIELIANRGKK